MKKEELEEIRGLLASQEALGIICYSKHHDGSINMTRLSEMMKVPVNKLKDLCKRLEELKALKVIKAGPDNEIELLDRDNEELKKMFDEIIWENKQEYGKVYKKLITAELLDFMGDK